MSTFSGNVNALYDKNSTIKENVSKLKENISFAFPVFPNPIGVDMSDITSLFTGSETNITDAGRFNVVDISFNYDSDPTDGTLVENNLYTQTAGKEFNVKIIHLDDDNETLAELGTMEVPFVVLELVDDETGKVVERFIPSIPFFGRKSVNVRVTVK